MLRSPLLPYSAFATWADGLPSASDQDVAALRDRLRRLIDRPELREALAVASPSLDDSIAIWLSAPESPRGRKTELALTRYLARAAGRCTPFGLFASVTASPIGDRTSIDILAASGCWRRARVDAEALVQLCEQIVADRETRRRLRFTPNDSAYPAGDRVRFAAARGGPGGRRYEPADVVASELLAATVSRAKAGATLDELADHLVEHGCERADAAEFVDQLVDAQLLVPELRVTLTGPDPATAFLSVIDRVLPGHPVGGRLRDIDRRLRALDGAAPGEAIDAIRALREEVASLVPGKPRRTIQVDLVRPPSATVVGEDVVQSVERGVALLWRLSPTQLPMRKALDEFRLAFEARFGEAEVALTTALDPDLGIGFGSSKEKALARSWGDRETYLLHKVSRGPSAIELDEADLAALDSGRTDELPDAFSVMASLLAPRPDRREAFRVLLPGGAGPSGTHLLGRFAVGDGALEEMIKDHIRREEALRPDAEFAEVVHLPEGAIASVQCRPLLRSFEIPFLGASGASAGATLALDDLLVSVQGERVVLRSRRLGREVVPRQASAHNYQELGFGAYRFLAALQDQDGGVIGWSWGVLGTAPFLPRVTHKELILSRARWMLTRAELAPLAARTGRREVFELVTRLREERGLPRFVTLIDSDNEMPVDLDNALSVESFARLVDTRDHALLYERFEEEELAASGPDGRYEHQLVVAFTRDREPDAAPRARSLPAATRHGLGDEWLTLHLHGGALFADRVLCDLVAPLREAALDSGAIDRWFFLRYDGGQGPHLRLRLHGRPERLLGEVLPRAHALARPLLEQGNLVRMVSDEYAPELARYGGAEAMPFVEEIFWRDSEAVLEIVELLEPATSSEARWRLALRGIDLLWRDLGFDGRSRAAAARAARDGLAHEQGQALELFRSLGERWRTSSADLAPLLDEPPPDEHPLSPGLEVLGDRSAHWSGPMAQLRDLAARGLLISSMERIAGSLVHMHINRLLHVQQRSQEVVLYDFLRRHHERRLAAARMG